MTIRPALSARAGMARPAARANFVTPLRARSIDDEEKKALPFAPMILQQGFAALLAGLFVTVAAPVDAAALSGSAYSKVC